LRILGDACSSNAPAKYTTLHKSKEPCCVQAGRIEVLLELSDHKPIYSRKGSHPPKVFFPWIPLESGTVQKRKFESHSRLQEQKELNLPILLHVSFYPVLVV